MVSELVLVQLLMLKLVLVSEPVMVLVILLILMLETVLVSEPVL